MDKLTISNMELYYGDFKALKGINLNIQANKITAFIGPSGCGKSTLALSLMGYYFAPLHYISGDIIVDGRKISGMKPDDVRKNILGNEIAYIPQAAMNALNPTQKIIRFVEDVIHAHDPKMPRKDIYDLAKERFQILGLPEEVLQKHAVELSGGMKQRVMIAIALVSRPSVIICDEPTTSLDVTIEAQILDLLLELREKLGTSIIMITHDLGVISRLCDRVVVMYGGKIVEKGEIGEIFYNTAHPYTKGLIQSIAKLETAKGEKLNPIEGTPPDLYAPPKVCQFAARCESCMDVCEQLPPEAYTVADDHTTFCWLQHEMAPETDLKKATAKKGEV